eukprot:XP_020400417.1 uncharacterized protein LOC109942682 [Zea mays]
MAILLRRGVACHLCPYPVTASPRTHKKPPSRASAAAPLGQLTPTSPPLSPISAALAACRVSPSRSPLSLHQAHRRTDVGHEPPSQELRLLGTAVFTPRRAGAPLSRCRDILRRDPFRELRSVSELQGIKDRALATKRSSFLRSTTLNTLSICLVKVAFGAIYAQVKKRDKPPPPVTSPRQNSCRRRPDSCTVGDG